MTDDSKTRLTDEEVSALLADAEEVSGRGLFLVPDFPKLRAEIERLRKYEADWEAFREAFVAFSSLTLAVPREERR